MSRQPGPPPSPWAAPPAGGDRHEPPSPPRQRGVVPLAAGALAVLVAGLAVVATRDTTPGEADPEAAIEAWLSAAADGDVEELRETVAPSQRGQVDAADPFGLARPRLEVDGLSVGEARRPELSVDEAFVEVGGEVCPDDAATGGCRSLVGSGPGGAALAVREQGRWWSVAHPVRLAEPLAAQGAAHQDVDRGEAR